MVFLLENPPLAIGAAFIILGLFTAVFGALLLSIEEGMKEALSYDTVKNTGLVFAFFGAALIGARFSLPTLANASLFAAFLVFVSHTFVKSGLLLGSGVIALQTRTDSLEGMGGLARRMPRFSVVFGVLALCAAALPPSGAFLGASGFAEGALSDIHAVPSQFGILLGIAFALFFLVNGLTFFGMVKVFAMAFLGRPSSLGAENAVEPDLGYFAPIACLALLAVAAGLFAPELFSRIGANTHFATDAFSGPRSTIVFLGIVVVVVILRMFFTSPKKVRMQSPWNGGEALTPRMEYTATAFGSPLRFFFRFLLTFHRRRVMVSTPLLSTNPWFTVKAFRRETDPSWKKIIAPYLLGAKGLFLRILARLQSGNVQTYVAMMLLTLSACILLAL
jgi:NADH:ubiquinone oxidoreductase subunit 5 (subunit L)/multisubunit Na+/H+ antiporter MnhA subunit